MVQSIDYLAVAPPVILALTAILVLVVDAFWPGPALNFISLAGIAAAGATVGRLALSPLPRTTFCVPGSPISCLYQLSPFALMLDLVVLISAVVVVLIASVEAKATGLPAGEFGFLLLSSLSGILVLTAAGDLITLVVALEMLTLPVFALVALRRKDGRSSEAAVKMFLFSVVSTAVTLYGISLVYGATGTVFFSRIAVSNATGPLTWVAILFVVVGFGFKIAVIPFHFWAPDSYSGAPVSVAGFLSVISKAGGFAGLILVLVLAFGRHAQVWGPGLAVIAAVTMTIGNLVALRQTKVVRLLAWSSIAHAGYMLAPLGALAGVAGRPELIRDLVGATVGYLAIYALMTIGVFAVVTFAGWVGRDGGGSLDDYRGLARPHPLVALSLAFLLASLAGIPPGLAGLFAKIFVFKAAVTGGYGWLAVVMAINAVIGLYYYLSWGVRLFGRRPDEVQAASGPVPRAIGVAIATATAGIVALSVVPQLVLGFSP